MQLLDLAQSPARYSGWTIRLADLGGSGETYDKPTRTAVIDPAPAGPRKAIAHALAHIKLGHVYDCPAGALTDQQCDDASGHADYLLGFELSWAKLLEVA